MPLDLRRLVPADLPQVNALLEASGLSGADLSSSAVLLFVALDPGLVGVVGLERHGELGLLRSLAVTAGRRRQGLAARLVQRIESEARAEGIKALYLLTTTAAAWFSKRDYVRLDRALTPAEIQGTAQFETLCSKSSTVLWRKL